MVENEVTLVCNWFIVGRQVRNSNNDNPSNITTGIGAAVALLFQRGDVIFVADELVDLDRAKGPTVTVRACVAHVATLHVVDCDIGVLWRILVQRRG